jgi:UDP-glucose 4-epimerase
LNLVRYIETVGGCQARISHQAARTGDIRASYAGIKNAELNLAFRYTTSLEEGMRILLATVAA